ncbi:unnamed protein product [Euphydryas editha]|uniref:Uncharacterized protein n=1 Tax=Euphydryas editha TaxID=104508 RepID=A0AAU9TGG8_EUPED|nr:unnamed protein product [Euphydryas editha]
MPRMRRPVRRKEVYWWSPDLVDLCDACIRDWRSYNCSQRRRIHDVEQESQLYAAHNQARAQLKRAIFRVKDAK